jgi:hypothetical protein
MHTIRFTVLALACFATSYAFAHHSFAAEFLGDQTRTIEGTVTEVWFKNPHVRYYIEVTNEDGDQESWDVRTGSPTLLVRRGWTQDTIREGDKIKVTGFLGRDGRKLLSVINIVLPDGTVLGQEGY